MKQKQKEITTEGSGVRAQRLAQERARRKSESKGQASSWGRSTALGLPDEDLIIAATSGEQSMLPVNDALDELEARMGWQRAADMLSASSTLGASLAQERWGGWLAHARSTGGRSGSAQRLSPGALASSVASAAPALPSSGPVQLVVDPAAGRAGAHAAAALEGAKEALPHGERIQAAFGHHDVSGVRAATGADDAVAGLGAEAFAVGERMAFREQPDLFLAAHEAAHVIQQRAGLSGGATGDRRGDALEMQADAIAQQVVAGVNVEGLLDGLYPGALSGDGGAVSLQLFKAQIVAEAGADGEGLIREVLMSGRTDSPFFGTMGAHSTAWIAHTDSVRRQLQGLTLTQAIAVLDGLVDEALASPQKDMGPATGIFQQGAFTNADKALRAVRGASAKAAKLAEHEKAVWIQDYIETFLDFTNNLPMATVQGGSSDGAAEGVARAALNAVEGGEAPPAPAVLQEALAGLFAADTPGAFVLDANRLSHAVDPNEAWAAALHGYLRTLRHAYPICFNAAGLADRATLGAFVQTIGAPAGAVPILEGLAGYAHAAPAPAQANLSNAGGDRAGDDFVVQLRLTDATVSDMVTEGRTPSPFIGSMGAHSTAWKVQVDAIRALVVGQDLDGAIAALMARAEEALTSSALQLIEVVLPDQLKLIARADAQLRALHGLVRLPRPAVERISIVQMYISALLQFINALPMSTVEAADTTGKGEGTAVGVLRRYESGTLKTTGGKKITKGSGKTRTTPKVSPAKQVQASFWKLLDVGAIRAFSEQLMPEVVPPESTDAPAAKRPRRATARKADDARREQIMVENGLKAEARQEALRQKPLDKAEQGRLTALHDGAQPLPGSGKAMAAALALHEFLTSMSRAYPQSFALCWGGLGHDAKAAKLDELDLDGANVLPTLLAMGLGGPKVAVGPVSYASTTGADDARDIEAALRESEQANAERDGITAAYVIGHASGRANACLIHSLLFHALGRDPTTLEVDAVRGHLAADHPDIAAERAINIYSDTGHAVIAEVERRHGVQLNVSVVTTAEAPEVPVTNRGGGGIEALLYLMPGHFVPCTRR